MSDKSLASRERMLQDAPLPWSASTSPDGLHALVDANDKLIARSPMFAWLEAIADLANEAWQSASPDSREREATEHEQRGNAAVANGLKLLARRHFRIADSVRRGD